MSALILLVHADEKELRRLEDFIEEELSRIRKKLGADVITTIRGLGYSLEDPTT